MKSKFTQRRYRAPKRSTCALCKPHKQGWADKKHLLMSDAVSPTKNRFAIGKKNPFEAEGQPRCRVAVDGSDLRQAITDYQALVPVHQSPITDHFPRSSFLLLPATPFITFQLIRNGNALTTILPLRYTYYYDYEISCCYFCNRTCHRLRGARSITHRERVAR
jgi:hypothetical protein